MCTCEKCGREFKTIQALKSHERKHGRHDSLATEEHVCQHCGKVFYGDWRKAGSGKPRFCSKACANARIHTPESRQKVSRSLLLRSRPFLRDEELSYDELKTIAKKEIKSKNRIKRSRNTITKICKDCGQPYPTTEYREEHKKYKGVCKSCSFKRAGRFSASIRSRTSRAERYFQELCRKEGYNILCNEPMFNGYDADVILPDYKVAVHWNGPWHYEGYIIGIKDHSYKQVHNRDVYKYRKIEECGYKNYIIKYVEKYNGELIQKEFDTFKSFLKTLQV